MFVIVGVEVLVAVNHGVAVALEVSVGVPVAVGPELTCARGDIDTASYQYCVPL